MIGGDIQLAWDALSVLLVMGFTIAVVVAVVVGAVRIGWQLAPWILGFAAIVWFLN